MTAIVNPETELCPHGRHEGAVCLACGEGAEGDAYTDFVNTSPHKDDRAYITTFSGAKFYIDECNIEDVPIEDIAHALSMNCRFNGHIRDFYSVAEHCVAVSHFVPYEHRGWALMHDVSEAFVPDIPRPFKSKIKGFDHYEERILRRVADVFGLTWPIPDEVLWVDHNIVAAEAAHLYDEAPDWIAFYEHIPFTPRSMKPKLARQAWLDRYYWIFHERR